MRAAYIEETGPPEVIKVGELPRPEPGPGQVLVRVQAAALNPIDLYIRSGAVAMPLPFPYVIACDLAGTVEQRRAGLHAVARSAIASGARTRDCWAARAWRPNTPRSTKRGSTPRPRSCPTPRPRRWRWSGSPPTSGLFQFGQLKAGEVVVRSRRHRAASARWSCRWPRRRAAAWPPSAGSPERIELCRRLGADLALNYKTDDIPARLREILPPRASTSGTRPSASRTSRSPSPCSASTAG